MIIIVIALALMLAVVAAAARAQFRPLPRRTLASTETVDFATQREAQRFYLAAGGPVWDTHRLDGDRDGIACELLP